MNLVTLGTLQTDEIVLEQTFISASLPASKDAQREKKWLVRYHDATNQKKYSAEIPCADLSLLRARGASDQAVAYAADLISMYATAIAYEHSLYATLFDDPGHENPEIARVMQRFTTVPAGKYPTMGSVAPLMTHGKAAKLWVTPKTMEMRLSSAYAKLGIRSRTQLAERLAAPA